jgi:hypothetical protein
VVVGPEGQAWLRLEGYRTVELPAPVDDAALAPLHQAVATGHD